MDAVIEYRDIALEHGTFDEVVAITEDRIAALKAKGFREVRAEFHVAAKTMDGAAHGWTVTLEARKTLDA